MVPRWYRTWSPVPSPVPRTSEVGYPSADRSPPNERWWVSIAPCTANAPVARRQKIEPLA